MITLPKLTYESRLDIRRVTDSAWGRDSDAAFDHSEAPCEGLPVSLIVQSECAGPWLGLDRDARLYCHRLCRAGRDRVRPGVPATRIHWQAGRGL